MRAVSDVIVIGKADVFTDTIEVQSGLANARAQVRLALELMRQLPPLRHLRRMAARRGDEARLEFKCRQAGFAALGVRQAQQLAFDISRTRNESSGEQQDKEHRSRLTSKP